MDVKPLVAEGEFSGNQDEHVLLSLSGKNIPIEVLGLLVF